MSVKETHRKLELAYVSADYQFMMLLDIVYYARRIEYKAVVRKATNNQYTDLVTFHNDDCADIATEIENLSWDYCYDNNEPLALYCFVKVICDDYGVEW